jgi:nucleotide-binding universal stress UspA family protein
MYDRILLATDGTVASENATDHALDLATTHGATLHALFVVDEDVYSAYSGDEYADGAEGPEHGLEERGRTVLGGVAARGAEADVEVVERLERGRPAETIVGAAKEADAELVVLGTRHRPSEYRNLLGSVTDRVLRLTDRPAVVVKTEVDDGAA